MFPTKYFCLWIQVYFLNWAFVKPVKKFVNQHPRKFFLQAIVDSIVIIIDKNMICLYFTFI